MLIEILLIAIGVLVAIWLSRQLHKLSHYIIARKLQVPKKAINILFENGSAAGALNKKHTWIFFAAGITGETLFMIILSVLLLVFNFPITALILFGTSTILFIFHLMTDLVRSYKASKPVGDVTKLWRIYKTYTYILIVTILTLRAMLLIVIGVFSLVSHAS